MVDDDLRFPMSRVSIQVQIHGDGVGTGRITTFNLGIKKFVRPWPGQFKSVIDESGVASIGPSSRG